MNDRFNNDQNRRFGESRDEEGRYGRTRGRNEEGSSWSRGRNDERSGFGRGRNDEQGYQGSAAERLYSSDEDETYGSEWRRGRGDENRVGERAEHGSGQNERSRGWYGRGQAGMYGSGSTGGGYVGGYGSSSYGGSTGTDYGGGGYVGGGSEGGGYGGYTGGGYGSSGNYGSNQQRGFGGGRSQGYRGSDFRGAGSTLGSTGGYAGRGPKGYSRSDDRIREDVCDRLSADDDVDASEIEVTVKDGEVTLTGSVQTRSMKHQAEDLADDVLGVKDVHNNLRVAKGLLTEIKDKLSGNEGEGHYANGGTKNTPASSSTSATNGRL